MKVWNNFEEVGVELLWENNKNKKLFLADIESCPMCEAII
jgi:hypothetical protein